MAEDRDHLIRWLAKHPREASFGIDEGGTALVSTLDGSYLEIGGMPDEEEDPSED